MPVKLPRSKFGMVWVHVPTNHKLSEFPLVTKQNMKDGARQDPAQYHYYCALLGRSQIPLNADWFLSATRSCRFWSWASKRIILITPLVLFCEQGNCCFPAAVQLLRYSRSHKFSFSCCASATKSILQHCSRSFCRDYWVFCVE